MQKQMLGSRKVKLASRVAILLLLPFATGCGKVPTWNELTQQPVPQQGSVVAAPAPVQPTVTPPPPPKPVAAVVLATFRSLKPHEVSDAKLAELASLTEGLETVTDIDAAGSQISGAGLANLSKLPALNTLNLSSTLVSDEGMQHLTRVPGLESLSLNGTKISDDGLAVLTGCTNLKKLEIKGCHLTPNGFAAIGKMPVLEEINLDNTAGINDITFDLICNASTLKRLHMNYVGGITDNGMRSLSKLEVLEELHANECPITCEMLAQVAKSGLKNLKQLAVNRCPITLAGAKAINMCKSLEHLNVGNLPMDDKGLVILTQGLTKLKVLHLNGCNAITGSGFTAIKAANDLEILTLRETSVVDQGLILLKGHKHLRRLELVNTKVSEVAVQALRKALPDCEIIH